MSLFLLLYSNKSQLGVKTRFCLSHLQETTLLIVQLKKRIQENRKMIMYIYLELSFRICMEMGDMRKKLQ